MGIPIYETEKMFITREGNSVVKTYKKVRGYKQRYKTEKAALGLLKEIPGVPTLLDFDDEQLYLKMSCLPGKTPVLLQPNELAEIKAIITNSLQRGVARHSLPIRDILCTGDGKVSMVDFERLTLKNTYNPLVWGIAKKVTLFHLNRLIYEHQPQLLNRKEAFYVSLGFKFRKFFRKYMLIRDKFRN